MEGGFAVGGCGLWGCWVGIVIGWCWGSGWFMLWHTSLQMCKRRLCFIDWASRDGLGLDNHLLCSTGSPSSSVLKRSIGTRYILLSLQNCSNRATPVTDVSALLACALQTASVIALARLARIVNEQQARKLRLYGTLVGLSTRGAGSLLQKTDYCLRKFMTRRDQWHPALH